MDGQANSSSDDVGDKSDDAARGTTAAERAAEEAALRRSRRAEIVRPAERGGREGLDPSRYGDWENKGLASDF